MKTLSNYIFITYGYKSNNSIQKYKGLFIDWSNKGEELTFNKLLNIIKEKHKSSTFHSIINIDFYDEFTFKMLTSDIENNMLYK